MEKDKPAAITMGYVQAGFTVPSSPRTCWSQRVG